MTRARAKRLYETESKWVDAGGGETGRNKGKSRRSKKARAHSKRLEALRIKAGL